MTHRLMYDSGVSDQPWAGEVNLMNGVFDHFIRVPKLTYGSRRLLIKHFIHQLGGMTHTL